jgi:nudix-type nucleoside diphosphatase (YffH/AdpP family)
MYFSGMDKQIMIINTVVLSDNRYILRKVNYEYTEKDGRRAMQSREVYDRGNGAVILLYNKRARTVILTRQFRMPTYLNGNATGMLIEACAGLLDKDNPEVAIRRETEEETGYKIGVIEKVFESYMSPGSVTEILYFFVAEYEPSMKVSDGGGLEEEQEEIEVLELSIDRALEMVKTGEIRDGKTIMLLQHVRLAGIM